MSQPPSYGSMPPPGYPSDESPPATPPTNVQRAVTCLYALAAVQVLSLVYSLTSTDSTRDAIREADTSLSDSEVSTALAFGLIVVALFGAVFVGLYVLCGRKMQSGRNWARITATVLTGLLLMLGALSLAGGALVEGDDAVTTFLTLIELILAIAFLVLAWTKPANDYFAAAGARR